MSGVRVIWHLRAADAAVVAIAKRANIMAGTLPQSMPLPGIAVTQISSIPFRTLAMSLPLRLHTDRVQVTGFVKDQQSHPDGGDYPALVALMKAILDACPNQHGTVNGVIVDSILPDIEGPDLPILDAGILTRSRDFIVRYVDAS